MTLLLFFYWIVCGIVVFGKGSSRQSGIGDLILCMVIGGFLVPAWIVGKALR